MNNTEKAYEGLIGKLVEVDKKIKAWQEFLGKLIGDRAKKIELQLTMEEKKHDKVDYKAEEEERYGERPGQMLGMIQFAWTGRVEEKEDNGTPKHEIREEMAIQICRGVLQQLGLERDGLLKKLGIVTAKKDAKIS